MANEYADNIRRIARGDRRRGGLSQQGERDEIESGSVPLLTNAEIAELNNEEPTPPSTAPENEDIDPEDEEQQDNIDPNDPNSYYRGAQSSTGSQTDEGTYDVGDVIDGTGNAPGSAPGSSGTQNSGALRELTGLKDCESGTPFNLHLDGNFIPPEGWDDPETPPPVPEGEFIEGYIFYYGDLVDSGFHISATLGGAKSELEGWITSGAAGNDFNVSFKEWRSDWFLSDGVAGETSQQWQRQYSYNTSLGGTSNFTATIDMAQCGSSQEQNANNRTGEECSWTEENPPSSEDNEWPEDGTYDLAIRDGQLQTSEFDQDKPRDESLGTKPFCFGDGRTGNAHVTADGGLMVYETGENGAPLPGAAARVYDSAGDFRAAGDATETFISQYLPK